MERGYRQPGIGEFVEGFKYQVLHTYGHNVIDIGGNADKEFERVTHDIWVPRTFSTDETPNPVDDLLAFEGMTQFHEDAVDKSLKHIEELMKAGSVRCVDEK